MAGGVGVVYGCYEENSFNYRHYRRDDLDAIMCMRKGRRGQGRQGSVDEGRHFAAISARYHE